jgi:hypothetical protein
MIREREARFLFKSIQLARCASVLGLSNMGKTALLRDLCTPKMREQLLKDNADDWLFVYVDCNLMPERSEQALHEATLRSMLSTLRRSGANDELLNDLGELYQEVIQPSARIRSPLSFESALRKVCEEAQRGVAIFYDEFDDPFEKLDGRVFLNLRAIKDEYESQLSFVTATERPLGEIRNDREASEFAELFANRECWLGFLNQDDAREVANELAQDVKLSKDELDFIVFEAGGHAGMLKAVTEAFTRIAAGAPETAREQALAFAKQALDDEPNVSGECIKLWRQLNDNERNTLMDFFDEQTTDSIWLAELREKHLLNSESNANDAMIGNVWRSFVKRQSLTRPGAKRGVTVDVDSGDVSVDGKSIEPLTELEYKLLLLLYGKLNKIVDKFTIVTHVWGETYLDNVDDARIEKLVSRLRSKLEPNADEPKHLITLRGRGYKLVG